MHTTPSQKPNTSIYSLSLLLSCPFRQVTSAVKQATGMDHTTRTEDDIKKWFSRADFDHSGTLSKREFVVMYIGLLADKAKLGAGGLAKALCAALDTGEAACR
jgi:hypothetical protein